MESAALPSPVIVGSSGIEERKISRWFLKYSVCCEFMLRSLSGRRLKILTPFTPSDCSLAFLTHNGAVLKTVLGVAILPLLPCPDVNVTS